MDNEEFRLKVRALVQEYYPTNFGHEVSVILAKENGKEI